MLGKQVQAQKSLLDEIIRVIHTTAHGGASTAEASGEETSHRSQPQRHDPKGPGNGQLLEKSKPRLFFQ